MTALAGSRGLECLVGCSIALTITASPTIDTHFAALQGAARNLEGLLIGSRSYLTYNIHSDTGLDRTAIRSTKTMAVQEQFVIDAKGRKTGVILSMKRYEKLLEDLHDLAIVAERRAEKPVSLEEMKRRLKADGIL